MSTERGLRQQQPPVQSAGFAGRAAAEDIEVSFVVEGGILASNLRYFSCHFYQFISGIGESYNARR